MSRSYFGHPNDEVGWLSKRVEELAEKGQSCGRLKKIETLSKRRLGSNLND